MTTSHRIRPLSVVAGLAVAGAAQAAVVPAFDISVSDMNGADWAQTVTAHQGTGAVGFFPVTHAADPANTFWRTQFNIGAAPAPRNSSDVVANVYLVQAWDPATQGALDRLDVVLDARGLSSGFSNGVAGFLRPVVEQGGRIFSVLASDLAVAVGSSFDSLSWQLEDTADWRAADGSAALPDFSAQGAPLHFGYRFGLQTTCTGNGTCRAVESSLGVDNFRVDVIPGAAAAVPEPALPALLLAALGAASLSRRRR